MHAKQKSLEANFPGRAVFGLFSGPVTLGFEANHSLFSRPQFTLTNQCAEFGNRRVARKSRTTNVASVREYVHKRHF
jgi:hypothetical protein